jgi:hypothetical protein|tara:strand:- start:73 stop:753 length:681 start_codon:yes stop_codon:yes gene_type:complete
MIHDFDTDAHSSQAFEPSIQATTMASTASESATTEFTQRMAQVLVANPDRRTRKHKQAVEDVYVSTIASLIGKLSKETTRNKVLRTRVALANRDDDEPTPSCSICMDDMHGRVTLVCGHEMCPECFAQHSRVNNTCPFCREEFAPKPKKQSKIPLYQIDYMTEMWANTTTNNQDNYFRRHTAILLDKDDGTLDGRAAAEARLRWLITENGKILMGKVKNWYDNDIA